MTKQRNAKKGNINTKKYWDNRFDSGDWEKKGGTKQTTDFATCQVSRLAIKDDFNGTIIDYGCGLGDAMPIFHAKFPLAKLIGVDISSKAIDLCREKYEEIAEFIQGDYSSCSHADVIVASNVFEHLTNDIGIATQLLSKCKDLYITVPYKEPISPGTEHINAYDENYFNNLDGLSAYKWTVFASKSYSQYGFNLFYNIYFKNIFRLFLGKRLARRSLQIMFHFSKPGYI